MHYKKTKFCYYLESALNIAWWKKFPFPKKRIWASLSGKEKEHLIKRRDYYIKIKDEFSISSDITLESFKRDGGITYYLDLKQLLVNFPSDKKFNYCFGDITHIPKEPAFVKSRPICESNENSVILPLNSIRHFNFIKDKVGFNNKKNKAVWRGNAKQAHRQAFLVQYFNNPLCDVGEVQGINDGAIYKSYMSIREQLKYKFIFSLEGNDVATSLKWIMSSNSIAIMPEPKFETWFMEGCLIPDVHYIKIKDDYSDIDDKIAFYLAHPNKCKEIIYNSNRYIEQFKNQKKERLLALMVISNYFSKSNSGNNF